VTRILFDGDKARFTRILFDGDKARFTRILFDGDKARVNVNGKLSQEFFIERQGCLVERYLFFIINELLNDD